MRFVLPCVVLLGVVVLGCAGPRASAAPTATAAPSPTQRGEPGASPTPIQVEVGSPFDAWSLVLPLNSLFANATSLLENAVGQSRFWVATPLDGGRFRIDVTVGSGDCPAGCIDRHVWSYEVWPDGRVELVSETGPEVPPDIR